MSSATSRDQQPSGSNVCPQREFPVHLIVNKHYQYSKSKLPPSATAICEKMNHMRVMCASMDRNDGVSSSRGVSTSTCSTATADNGESCLGGTLNIFKKRSYYSGKKGNYLSGEKSSYLSGQKGNYLSATTIVIKDCPALKNVLSKSSHGKKCVCGCNDSNAMEVYKTSASVLSYNKYYVDNWKRGLRVHLNQNGVRTDIIPRSRTRMLPLPYHEILCSPIVSTPLSSSRVVGSYDSQKYIFSLDEALTRRIMDSKENSSDIYSTQVLVRFCVDDWSCTQAAAVPECIVIVNGKKALLQKENLKNVEPLDITKLCELTRGEESVNILHVEWKHCKNKCYCMSVSVGLKLTVAGMVSKLMKENVQGSCITRKMAQDKLKSDAPDIRFISSLNAQLTCPVGKTRLVTPCRGSACTHIQCMDALTLLKLYEGRPLSSKKCYMCDKPFGNIVVDGLFLEILQCVPKYVDEVEFIEDGSWSYIADTGYRCMVKTFTTDKIEKTGEEHTNEHPSDDPHKMHPACSKPSMKTESISKLDATLNSHVQKVQSQMDQLEYLSRKHEQRIDDLDGTDTSICDLTVDAMEAMSTNPVSEVQGSEEICCIQVNDDVESSKSVVDLTNDPVDSKPDVNSANYRLGSRINVKCKQTPAQSVEQCVEVEISRLLKISNQKIKWLNTINKTKQKKNLKKNRYVNKNSRHFDSEDGPRTVFDDKDVNQHDSPVVIFDNDTTYDDKDVNEDNSPVVIFESDTKDDDKDVNQHDSPVVILDNDTTDGDKDMNEDDSPVVIFESDTTDDEDIIEIDLNLDKGESVTQSDQSNDVDKSTNLMAQTAEKEMNFMKEDGTSAYVSDYSALYVRHCLAYMIGSSKEHALTENDNAGKEALSERVSSTKRVAQDETGCIEKKACFDIVPDIDSITKDQTHIVTKGSRSIDELLNIKRKHDGTAEMCGTDGKFVAEILNSGGKIANKFVDLHKKDDQRTNKADTRNMTQMKQNVNEPGKIDKVYSYVNPSSIKEIKVTKLMKSKDERNLLERNKSKKYQTRKRHLEKTYKEHVMIKRDRKCQSLSEHSYVKYKKKNRVWLDKMGMNRLNKKVMNIIDECRLETTIGKQKPRCKKATSIAKKNNIKCHQVFSKSKDITGMWSSSWSPIANINNHMAFSSTAGREGKTVSSTSGSKGRKVSSLTAESEDKTVSLTSGSEGRKMSLTAGSEGRKMSLTSGCEGRKMSFNSGSEGRKMLLTSGSEGRKMSLTAGSEGRKMSLTAGSEGRKMLLTAESKCRKMSMIAGSKGRQMSLTAESWGRKMSLTAGSRGRKMSLTAGSRGRKMSLTAGSKDRKGCSVTETMETDAQSMDDIASLHNTQKHRNCKGRTLLVDNLTTLPNNWFGHVLFNDTVKKMDLAPPTKRLMKIMSSGMLPVTHKNRTWLRVHTNSMEILKRPGIPLQSQALRNLFDRNLLSRFELIADDHSEEILADSLNESSQLSADALMTVQAPSVSRSVTEDINIQTISDRAEESVRSKVSDMACVRTNSKSPKQTDCCTTELNKQICVKLTRKEELDFNGHQIYV